MCMPILRCLHQMLLKKGQLNNFTLNCFKKSRLCKIQEKNRSFETSFLSQPSLSHSRHSWRRFFSWCSRKNTIFMTAQNSTCIFIIHTTAFFRVGLLTHGSTLLVYVHTLFFFFFKSKKLFCSGEWCLQCEGNTSSRGKVCALSAPLSCIC